MNRMSAMRFQAAGGGLSKRGSMGRARVDASSASSASRGDAGRRWYLAAGIDVDEDEDGE